jgi:hypothetical protein
MLYTVINSVIMGFDISTPINCQVSLVVYVWPVMLSNPILKFWITSGLVSAFFYMHMSQHLMLQSPFQGQ